MQDDQIPTASPPSAGEPAAAEPPPVIEGQSAVSPTVEVEVPPPAAPAPSGDQVTQLPLLFPAIDRLDAEITLALSGTPAAAGVDRQILSDLCKVIDYWLDEETARQLDVVGLTSLAKEIKGDYVTTSLLAWRGDFKIASITLRSFLESFCLLLYYLNQGCDRLLFLKGKGYKLMLHRMAQKRNSEDEHAFRRHYHLLISESFGTSKAADKFFDEIDACYGVLSKAVHGEYLAPAGASPSDSYLDILRRVLRICNTLALHEPILDVTDDMLEEALDGVLQPMSFQWGRQ